MELVKVKDIINYEGRIYVIRPYIEEGKIKRNTIYSGIKEAKVFNNYGNSYNLGKIGNLLWYQTRFHQVPPGGVVDENTVASCITSNTTLRLFTDRESAKKALEEYEAQSTYRLSESIDRELKYLELEKKKINDKIKELKEKRKECFSKLTTSFVKKS
jgi:hypothetical protein